jgi:hypothetical protein
LWSKNRHPRTLLECDTIPIIATDANSSIGTNALHQGSTVVGPHGLVYVNASGKRFHSWAASSQLSAATTFFDHQHHATWTNPSSNKQHQIDHWFVRSSDLKRVTDAKRTLGLKSSDHAATAFTLRLKRRLAKSDPRSLVIRRDHTVLADPDTAAEYSAAVTSAFRAANLPASASTNDQYNALRAAIDATSDALLPTQRRSNPGWFAASEGKLAPLIDIVRQLQCDIISTTGPTNAGAIADVRLRLRRSRTDLQRAVRRAKRAWIDERVRVLHDGSISFGGSRDSWVAIRELINGLALSKSHVPRDLRKPDGTLSSSPAENATVFANAFRNLYERQPSFDPTVLNDLPSLPTLSHLADAPDRALIQRAIARVKDHGPGASGIRASIWKCLATSDAALDIIVDVIHTFWSTEQFAGDWDINLLKILPKKGDLSDVKNYRGIMLREIFAKIISVIFMFYLEPIIESTLADRVEDQSGFRGKRGTADANFNLRMALRKRHEHGEPTWVLYLDFVKAFDRVPRELLWDVLRRFGVPEKLVRLLVAMHANASVHFTVGEVSTVLRSIIGVLQGDNLAPLLFIIFMAAMLMSWEKRISWSSIGFHFRDDFVLTGRKSSARGTRFRFIASLFADDAALAFYNRSVLEEATPKIVALFRSWGMEAHFATPAVPKSKSEIVFYPQPRQFYDNPNIFDGTDTSPVAADASGGFIPVVDQFRYLGSITDKTLDDGIDVDNNIAKASQAFGALRKSIFGPRYINIGTKSTIYTSLVLSILLFGSESWCLTARSLNKLRAFHHRCARAIVGTSRWHSWHHHITNATTLAAAGIHSVESYVFRRQLRWAGHVARMPTSRLPRKFLSSWCRAKRPTGAPKLTYGRTLLKALKWAGIDASRWHVLAQDRGAWRETIAAVGRSSPAD